MSNLCSCGCGNEVGSEKFQLLHVDQEEEARRLINEQIEAQANEEEYRDE